MVRVSGHSVSLDTARVELEGYGFALVDVAVEGWQAIGVSATTDPSAPAIVVVGDEAMAFELLSYEVELDDLVRLAGQLSRVDAAMWVGAGGVILSGFVSDLPNCDGEVSVTTSDCRG